jgi:hypothetical protein
MWSQRRTSVVVAAGLCGAVLSPVAALAAGGYTASTSARDFAIGTRWVARYSAPGNNADYAHTLDVSPDGSTVFVTGQSDAGAAGWDYATAAYDAVTGAKRWAARYSAPGSNDAYADGLKVSPDGSTVFVTGNVLGTTSDDDYATVAYDASTGAERWVARYNGPGNGRDVPYDLAVSPDGTSVFVTGFSAQANGLWDYATAAYDTSTGTERWVVRFTRPASRYNVAYAIRVSLDGTTVFVTGNTDGVNGADYATVAYDASTGSEQWVAVYDGPGSSDDVAGSLELAPDGASVYVTGYTSGTASGLDYATVAYDASIGAEQWVATYNGPGDGDDSPASLGLSPDGSTVFVTGSTSGTTTDRDFGTVAYDAATGDQAWVTVYDGPGISRDAPSNLAVSPDGTAVFVTGYTSRRNRGSNYAIVAYDASTGGQSWVARYTGPGLDYDIASDIGVSPDGSNVFVTGYSTGATTGADYATVAYGIA